MLVDRQEVQRKFREYIEPYDLSDPKISLKAGHTYKVAMLCEDIATSLSLSKEYVDIAWLLGMLHDIGRFEQCRVFDTFSDADSVSHAHLAAILLFGRDYNEELAGIDTSRINLSDGPMIRSFIEDDSLDQLIYTAIANHSSFRIPEDLPGDIEMMCHILRDADKIDIIRVNIETPLEDIYNVSTKELRSCSITKEVLDSFYAKSCVLRKLKKTAVDNVVGHISLTFELVYERSLKLMKQQGYLDILMDFKSENEETNREFERIRLFMHEYLD